MIVNNRHDGAAPHRENVVGIVLAAGFSHRFGPQDKRLAPLPDGQLLLASIVSQASKAFTPLRVVLRSDDETAALGLPHTTPVLRVHNAEAGLGASLAEAIGLLEKDDALRQVNAAAILLGDMPSIRLETFHMLQRQAGQSRIVRPSHAGRPGHPVIIGRDFWPELRALQGDEGGKSVIQRHRDRYHEILVDDPGIHVDIDLREDLRQPLLPLP